MVLNKYYLRCFYKKTQKQFYLVLELNDNDHLELCNFLFDYGIKIQMVTKEVIDNKNDNPDFRDLFKTYNFVEDSIDIIKECLMMEEKL